MMNTVTTRKPIVFVATLMIAAGVLAACSSAGGDTQAGAARISPAPGPSSSASTVPSVGTSYVLKTLDQDFDAKYRITMDLLDGYSGNDNFVVLGTDGGQGMSAWTVANVYAEPCRWVGTLLDPPINPSVDGLVAGLASQNGRHASAATNITLDGFTGKFMELMVPARIDLADCHDTEFRTWIDPMGGEEPRARSARPVVDRRRRR